MEFQILGSSSAGNAAIIRTPQAKVLIDAGFSAKRLKILLQEVGETLDSINAVFFTHEHGDHTAGLRGLSRFPQVIFFSNKDTADCLQKKLDRTVKWQIFENGTTFAYKDLEIMPFSVPHDAYDPVGYVFKDLNESAQSPLKSLGWVTDLGHIPTLVRERVKLVETLVIESNYDEETLDADVNRPWSVKQRIKSRHGHLSNQATFEFILSMREEAAWKQIFLAHLSRDCNSVAKVKKLFQPLLFDNNLFTIDVIDPEYTGVPLPTYSQI